MKRRRPILSLAFLCAATPAAAGAQELAVAPNGAALAGLPLHLELEVPAAADGGTQAVEVAVDGAPVATLEVTGGKHEVTVPEARLSAGTHSVAVHLGDATASAQVRALPGWLSVLPPLLAIALALIFKDVLIALFVGLYVGSLALFGFHPFTAFARTIDHFVRSALADPDHAAILIFSALLGGMVGVISKSGGTQGIVQRLAPLATDARRGQLATWLMGVIIFFDDYANTLIVGTTMRPVTDRLRVSREKLAYIVDATAAPVASLFPISTWIGFEVGLIAAAFSQLSLPYDPYTAFIASIPYRFYPILALVFGFAVASQGRDFGPMLKAERRVAATGELLAADAVPLADYSSGALEPPAGVRPRARHALLPIATVIVVTVLGLFVTGASAVERSASAGTAAWLRDVFSHADSYAGLLWASLAGAAVALLAATAGARVPVRGAMMALLEGMKAMLLAFVVLILAWSLGAVCGELHTADFVVALTQGVLSPFLVPVLVFVTSAAISFATGTSWATMAILMPLVIPVIHRLSEAAGHGVGSDAYWTLLLGTISSVLAGSVWGDHCSPISDTTILSSMSSGCDHIAHVRTQGPYAVVVGVVGMLVGDIPTAFGLSPWISLAVGTLALVALVRWVGQPVRRPAVPAPG